MCLLPSRDRYCVSKEVEMSAGRPAQLGMHTVHHFSGSQVGNSFSGKDVTSVHARSRPTMLRRGSRTGSSAKRKTHSCTEVAATQVAEGWTKTQRLKGCTCLLSMVDNKYTRARVQMRQQPKSLAALKSFLHHGILPRMDPYTRWSHREDD